MHRFVPINMSAIDSGRIAKTEMRRSVWMSLTCSGSTHRYLEKVRSIITISFPRAALRRAGARRGSAGNTAGSLLINQPSGMLYATAGGMFEEQ